MLQCNDRIRDIGGREKCHLYSPVVKVTEIFTGTTFPKLERK